MKQVNTVISAPMRINDHSHQIRLRLLKKADGFRHRTGRCAPCVPNNWTLAAANIEFL